MNYGLGSWYKDPRDYIFGKTTVPRVPYQPDGNWEPYLPKYEPQAENYETSGCTVWAALNQLEILYKRIYGVEMNYSERFTYLMAGVNPDYGADPNQAYEAIRKHGLVMQEDLPVPATLARFLTPQPMTGSLLAKGQYWKSRHDYKHELVAREDFQTALTYSPLAVSVTAWRERNGKYVSDGQRNNHLCVLFRIDEQGMWVMDSYDHHIKCLSHDHEIAYAKRIWINRTTKKHLTLHRNLLQIILNRLMNKPTLLEVCKSYLATPYSPAKDASPDDRVDDRVGCAESVTTLLKKVYPETPIITGTYTLLDHLKNPKNGYVKVDEPTPETIIISATGTGNGSIRGHVGIFGENGIIMSNSSENGTWEANYDYETWAARYKHKGGMPIYLFKKV